MFPEFKSGAGHPWNLVRLKPSDHWVAHYLLHRAIGSQATAYAWKLMSKAGRVQIADQECLREYEAALSMVAESCGRSMRGMVAAKDREGEIFHVPKDDPRLKSGELRHFAKGTVNVRDKEGRCFKVRGDDPRYLSGEVEHVRKGRVTARSGDGSIVDTTHDDPRLASGELVSVNKGYILVVGEDGKYGRVRTDAPDYASGLLVPARLGRGTVPDIRVRECPKCAKKMYYQDRYHRKSAEARGRACRRCSSKERAKRLRWPP
jgi:hypothetical protein